MKVLITGARGQLGSQIIDIIKKGESEIGNIDFSYKNAEIKGIDVEELDITDENAVIEYFGAFNPDIVINPAAYTDVDGCETNEELAYKVNSLGARNIAIACEKCKSKLIHISTDYVFSGDGQVPYREYDLTNPMSVYGKTKLLGEEYVRQFCSRGFIVRTAWLYGYNGQNFVKTIMKLAKKREKIDVVNDQRGNPTNAEDLAHHILKIALTEEYGIYHCTGKGECSWYDFACKIVEYAGIACTVSPVTSEKFKRPAKRPSFSSLDNMMLRCTVGDDMREWEDALNEFITRITK
ncbi:dTDP-4-dehydrorhamnose reductase [Clostridium tepidiprofundi DSM 19306]|uniref:dTDP-4-dehydrorhamnose reductase n=1 Tax=Clostridium tepidiprofundi DSM 19306 TaxID=1121338 RepID=A0A151B3H5_9CLOT|nr:dTDP-4-dehydrorhamnose reductase [Clostridium tepidiprofundi]KYH34461.1 dTDP-4-dehydrorhamnose reductase [Clostridium tepidiprofundi DSM 19306]